MRANIEDGDEKPVEENDSERVNVDSTPSCDGEGRAIEGGDLTPFEGYETHSRPWVTPNNWSTLTLLGAIQHTDEK
jgi:hypothetical protein